MNSKLIFINTHPIQYFAPLYKEITDEGSLELEVWYLSKHGLNAEIDEGFGVAVKWDMPILEGYKYRFFKNYFAPDNVYGFWRSGNLSLLWAIITLSAGTTVVFHGWNSALYIIAMMLGRITSKNVCLRAESPLVHETERRILNKILRVVFLKYFLFRIPQKFLYIGQQNHLFYQKYGVKAAKQYFAPYSVNNAYFTEKADELRPQKAKLKAQLNIAEIDTVLLFCGKLISKKRPMDLLLAYEKIQNRTNIQLIFMGDGPLKPELEQYIKQSNISNVHITGFVNQSKISNYYALADVFVMCSEEGETWGLSANEAMNFGLAIIISDKTGNHSDLVQDNGWVFKTGNVPELTQCIETYIALSPAQKSNMAQKSRNIIQNYSYQTIINTLKVIAK